MTDVTVVVAGEAGQGVRSAGNALTRLFCRAGYYVFAYPDVMSRIRGGHNFTRIRVSDQPVRSISAKVNVLLALDEFSVEEHRQELVEGGVILKEGPSSKAQGPDEEALSGLGTRSDFPERKSVMSPSGDGVRVVALPMQEIARQQGAGPASAGAVALGAVCALVGQELSGLEQVLAEQFSRKGRQVVKQNRSCARAGFKAIEEQVARECPCRIPPLEKPAERMLLTGNQAVAFGALSAGVRFHAGYPMSPSTGIMEFLAARQKEFGLVMEQAEDEIGAINMVLGASYAGARAMTATSGGGFSLMVEALGFSGMAELPVVIVICQRPGPATGFPTRTEQAELLFAVNASQDEFPRFVFAPGNAEQAALCTVRAFELSQRFQVPAIVLSDQTLADSLWTVDGDEPQIAQTTQMGRMRSEASADYADYTDYGYRRYELTEDGISPMLRPGTKDQLVCTMGSEHDEQGLASEDAGNRVKMQDKRMRKLAGMQEEFGAFTCYPDEHEDCLAVCFGSTLGPVREAVDRLQSTGLRVGMVHLHELWPFPRARLVARLGRARQVVVVENNATGQLARLLRRETRIAPDEQILKYDGRPFSGEELAERLSAVYRGRL